MKSNMQTIQHRWITKNPNTINFKVMHYRIFGSLLTVMFLRRWNLIVSRSCTGILRALIVGGALTRLPIALKANRSCTCLLWALIVLRPCSCFLWALIGRQGLCRIPLTCCSDSGPLFCCSISLMYFQQNYSISM